MQLTLDPIHNAAHGEWLRRVPGAYEWWYFDAVSDDRAWALTCIWFLGNPFSPYYRLAVTGADADPYAHNALFFALYHWGGLHAYHFTRFPKGGICADEHRPACLRFGPSELTFQNGVYRMHLSDVNGNGRRVEADLRFQGLPVFAPVLPEEDGADDGHFWLPAGPACRVSAAIALRETHNSGAERVVFSGDGYHDHNWGRLPFTGVRDWSWARASFPDGRAAVLYDVSSPDPRHAASHLLVFDKNVLVSHDSGAQVRRSRPRLNAFGTRYRAHITATGAAAEAVFHLGARLDSSPFYIRTLSRATLTQDGRREEGMGMAEYFRPRPLGTRLAASAMKARIVEA